MLVSRLALVDALPAPTAELRVQHRFVVDILCIGIFCVHGTV